MADQMNVPLEQMPEGYHEIVVVRHHDASDQTALGQLLDFNNLSRASQEACCPLAVLIKDGYGATIGGLWGRFEHDWLFIAKLVVPEHLRGVGVGRQIMETAQQLALAEGSAGIWLDTLDVQTAGFYAKFGFRQFGVIEDHPRGHRRLFLKKRFGTPLDKPFDRYGLT